MYERVQLETESELPKANGITSILVDGRMVMLTLEDVIRNYGERLRALEAAIPIKSKTLEEEAAQYLAKPNN